MKENLKNIKSRPQILLSLLGFVILSVAMLLMTYFYSQKTRAVLYNHIFDQLTSINTTKTHYLELFLKNKEADVTALSLNQNIIDMSKLLIFSESQSKKDKTTTFTNPYQGYLTHFLKLHNYTDILIMNAKDGDILYSLNYQQYIGKNLSSQSFKNSQMTRLWQQVLQTQTLHVSDMHTPVLYTDEPVMLIGAPIYDHKKLIAILMLKMPSIALNELLHVKAGNLKTYETYAIGQDHLFRSDSYLEKRFSVKNSFASPNSSKVYTTSINQALQGNRGFDIVKDYRGISVLSVYAAFKFDSLHWAIISEVDESEITIVFDSILKVIYIWTLFISFFLILIGYFILNFVIKKCVIFPLETLYNRAKGFEDIINDSLNEIYIFDKITLHFLFANRSAQENLGYSLETLQKMRFLEIETFFNNEEFHNIIRPLLEGTKQTQIYETMHVRKDGSKYDVFVHLQLMQIEGLMQFVALVNDMTEYKQVLQEKQHYYSLASHDHLTKIYNRQMFDTLFEKEFLRAERYANKISLILFDIDNFKMINDTFGHKKGDEVLIKIAACVTNFLRESDIFARWGGEEFVVLMLHTDINQAIQKADELREAISKLEFDFEEKITCSFGVAQIQDLDDITATFIQADKALYRAKERGKNRVEN